MGWGPPLPAATPSPDTCAWEGTVASEGARVVVRVSRRRGGKTGRWGWYSVQHPDPVGTPLARSCCVSVPSGDTGQSKPLAAGPSGSSHSQRSAPSGDCATSLGRSQGGGAGPSPNPHAVLHVLWVPARGSEWKGPPRPSAPFLRFTERSEENYLPNVTRPSASRSE